MLPNPRRRGRRAPRTPPYQESLRAEGPAPVRRGLGEVQEDGKRPLWRRLGHRPQSLPARHALRAGAAGPAAAEVAPLELRTSQEGFIGHQERRRDRLRSHWAPASCRSRPQAGSTVLFVEAETRARHARPFERLPPDARGLRAKGKLEAKAKDETLGRIAGTTPAGGAQGSDLVVGGDDREPGPSRTRRFAKLDRICPPHAILASNTSSCNVTAWRRPPGGRGRCSACTSSTRCR